MKINQALEQSQEKLKNNIKDYQKEALLIASFVLKLPIEKIISHSEKKIKNSQLKKILKLSKRRAKNWPLAYLTGTRAFYDLNFIVNKNVLIPRPESEIIIDNVLDYIENENKEKNYNIFDIGTGSGCLIISLAHALKNKYGEKEITFHGSDISAKALKIAKKNSKKNKLKNDITFTKGSLLKPFTKKIKAIKKQGVRNELKNEIILIANLPYLNKNEIKKERSLKMEPQKALYGGKNGLKLYEKLFEELLKIKFDKGSEIKIYTEINPWQRDEMEKIIEKILNKKGFEKVTTTIIQDLKQADRIILINILV